MAPPDARSRVKQWAVLDAEVRQSASTFGSSFQLRRLTIDSGFRPPDFLECRHHWCPCSRREHTHREGRAPAAMIRELGDEGFETDEEGEDIVGAFEHGTGILGASNLLRVASSVGLQGRSDEQLLTDVDDDSFA